MRTAFFEPGKGFYIKEEQGRGLDPNEVRLKVEACGVCGSDRQVVHGESLPYGAHFPLVMGHEIAGTVSEIGEAVGDWKIGDDVIVHPFNNCGSCSACLNGLSNLCSRQRCVGFHQPGGYSEEVVVLDRQLVQRTKKVHPVEAAILTDAYATPFHALQDAGVTSGSTLLVIGTGGLGLASLQLAKALEVSLLGSVTRREEGMAMASKFGAQAAFSMKEGLRAVSRNIRRSGGSRGFDCVLDTVGTDDTLKLALDSVRIGGTVSVIGMSEASAVIPIAKQVRRGITIKFSYGSIIQDLKRVVALTEEGKLKPKELIAGTLALTQIDSAFSETRSSGRWVVLPQST
ncbi:alcohol dehydrogenase catalytic domain-containing protein [Pullulanibacillus sp. KACC 23026]|uniref:alcohol dehydrogenase catalytic domain-containing protein n=1 Tax=Pullulanibacillus sp. KACC 23026 TaxID=3028315 RepID=UPI0023B122E2|nr:alcohol dehydrogenase catalytic domain-containing protein [Pullulanibacillus sp. KACC 23026]WEG10988.1 alcohol dehydrogenase catalytic domain-containing protein [Pullulanibacillus sp. KACC 23026]